MAGHIDYILKLFGKYYYQDVCKVHVTFLLVLFIAIRFIFSFSKYLWNLGG